jgi:hypothetical protein
MKTSSLVLIVAAVSVAFTLSFAHAENFSYQDDFETDAVMYDSWRHSHFLDTYPDFSLYGFLMYIDYMPPTYSRRLEFYGGFFDIYAYLAYQTIPAQALATAGSVALNAGMTMFPSSNHTIYVYGSANLSGWLLLGSFDSSEGDVLLLINEGDPVHFIQFLGDGVSVDDLNITIDYVIPITVITPGAGDYLVAGSSYTVRWETQYTIDNVTIEYSTDNGQNWTTIDTLENTGQYQWESVPEAESDQCQIRITDANNPAFTDTSDNFTIFICPAIIGDIDGDCYVDAVDYALLADQWHQPPGIPPADIAPYPLDDFVDFLDLAALAFGWLQCANPYDPACPGP